MSYDKFLEYINSIIDDMYEIDYLLKQNKREINYIYSSIKTINENEYKIYECKCRIEEIIDLMEDERL